MKKVFLLFILAAAGQISFSQKVALNFFTGLAHYEGDMQSRFFHFSQPRPAIGGGITYRFSDNVYIRAAVTLAALAADDKNNPRVYQRNLNFSTLLNEFHVAGEYYFLGDNASLSPYLFGGVAVFHFNPYTYDTSGTKYFLQPLSTEGQGFYNNKKNYSLTQFAIPYGAGIKVALSERLQVGVELGFRKLFTDYLDDVSTDYVDEGLLLANRGPKAVELAFRGGELKTGATYPTGYLKRGEPKNNDLYYFSNITLTITLPSRGEIDDRWISTPNGKKSILRCPGKVF